MITLNGSLRQFKQREINIAYKLTQKYNEISRCAFKWNKIALNWQIVSNLFLGSRFQISHHIEYCNYFTTVPMKLSLTRNMCIYETSAQNLTVRDLIIIKRPVCKFILNNIWNMIEILLYLINFLHNFN